MTLAITKPDYAIRDQKGKVVFYVLLWKRKRIKLEVFDDYWRNVHGPVCARLPKQHQYWQFHVDHDLGGLWPTIEGIKYNSLPEDQFDGIAELTYESIEDRQTWFQAAAILMDDEHNIFSKAIGYNTSPNNSKTYVDRIDAGDPNGELGIIKFHVMVKKADTSSVKAFRQYMTDSFAATVVQSDSVLKFRLHLFDEVDNSRPDAAGVVHFEAPEKQYQAAFEIAFQNYLEMEKFFASKEYAVAVKDQAKYVAQITPFPERATYTFVYDGEITLAGQRSSSVAELIMEVGATNQLQEDIVSLMKGQPSLSNVEQNSQSDLLLSDVKVLNTTTNSEVNFLSTTIKPEEVMLERLPGTSSDLVQRLFARGESQDSQGFCEFFTDTPVYQFGNFEICFDKAAIKKSADNFNSQVLAVYHEIKTMWEVGDVVFVEMDVFYWRLDGTMVVLPCCDIFRVEGNKFSELRIFMDVNPVFDPKIAVANTSSVLTVSEGKRVTPPGTMKRFYVEHPEGKQRVATGFAPKWTRFESKWSLVEA